VNDDKYWKVYLKVTDHNQQPIAADQHRARAEFTLTGIQFAKYVFGIDASNDRLATLADVRNFSFEGLAGLLHFRKWKSIEDIAKDKPKYVAYALEWLSNGWQHAIATYSFGRRTVYQDARRAKPRNMVVAAARRHSKHTTADEELNKLTWDRLRDLTKSFRTKI
jgi:hypothetical protein